MTLKSLLKTHHDVKKFVMMSKIRLDVKKFVMMSKIVMIYVKTTSWRQKHITSWRENTSRHDVKAGHDVKKFFMTSKTRHEIKKFFIMTKSRYHVKKSKTHHNIKKLIITSKTRHDVKNSVMTLRNTSWRQKFRHDVKNKDVQKFVMT